MDGYRRLIHSLLSLSGILVLVLGVLVGPHEPAGAAVNLVRFEVASAPDNSGIVVMWESASEFQTQAYHVYRAVASNDPEDAVEVGQEFASNTSGASYEWVDNGSDLDSGLESGREYFYWLYEVTQSGNLVLLSVGGEAYRSVVFGATPTPTATATSTVTPTESSEPGTTGSSPTSTHTPTRQPTATQRATNTPTFTPVVPSNTPPFTPVPPTSTPMVLTNTPTSQLLSTPVAPSTPTSVLPTATLLVIQPTVTDLAATSDLGTQPEVVPAALAQNATATTLPQQVAQAGTRQTGETEVTREARPTATPRPTEAAGSASQVSTLLLVVGGGSLCGAGMLILVALFVWRRR